MKEQMQPSQFIEHLLSQVRGKNEAEIDWEKIDSDVKEITKFNPEETALELLACLQGNQNGSERDLIATALFEIKPTDESVKEKIFVSMFKQTAADEAPYAAARAARHMIRATENTKKNGMKKQYLAAKALDEFKERAESKDWITDFINENIPEMEEFFDGV